MVVLGPTLCPFLPTDRLALSRCRPPRVHTYATAKFGHLPSMPWLPTQMAAASIHCGFRASVPKVGVVGGQRTVLYAHLESGGMSPAHTRHTFVSQNRAVAHNDDVTVNFVPKPQTGFLAGRAFLLPKVTLTTILICTALTPSPLSITPEKTRTTHDSKNETE